MNGFTAIFMKELAHIRRQKSTIIFALLVPAMQLVIFGFAANTTIRDIPLAVLNLDGRQDSRRLIDAFSATGTFQIAADVHSYDELQSLIRAGDAKAGLIIPPDYSDRLVRGEKASVQVQIDGSDSQVATTAMSTADLLLLNLAIEKGRVAAESHQAGPARDEFGDFALPMESRPRILFNPLLKDSFFFVPALIAIILQFVLSFQTAFAISRERESGTLEQLFVTPVSPGGLLLGKLVPYALMAAVELVVVLQVASIVFGVSVAGSMTALLLFSLIFIVAALGLGLMISTFAATQLEAMQYTFLIMLPSVLLSGFVFPRSQMPDILYAVSAILPATYFVDILRGIVVRGASAAEMAPSAAGLAACATAVTILSLARFRKTLD